MMDHNDDQCLKHLQENGWDHENQWGRNPCASSSHGCFENGIWKKLKFKLKKRKSKLNFFSPAPFVPNTKISSE